MLAAFFPLGRADGGFARLLARDWAKAMPTFARLLAVPKPENVMVRNGNGDADGNVQQEGDGGWLIGSCKT